MRLIVDHGLLQTYIVSHPEVFAKHPDAELTQIKVARSIDLALIAVPELA